MTEQPQPFSVRAARLQARKPWLSWSQVCAELGRHGAAARKARQDRKNLTVRNSAPTGPQWWQQ